MHLRQTRRDARPKWYVRAMFYCRSGAERCLEEVQIAPHATFFASAKSPSDMVHVVRTQHHKPTTPGAETIRTEGPYHGPINEVVVYFEIPPRKG